MTLSTNQKWNLKNKLNQDRILSRVIGSERIVKLLIEKETDLSMFDIVNNQKNTALILAIADGI